MPLFEPNHPTTNIPPIGFFPELSGEKNRSIAKFQGRDPAHWDQVDTTMEMYRNDPSINYHIKLPNPMELWYFHPVAFVAHLKRLFGKIITFEQLKKIAIYASDANINSA